MKLDVFQSDEGDCLLLTSDDGRRMLCDGGMAAAFRTHVSANLAKIPSDEKIDVVYISHIDSDHISGILEMMDNAVSWKVHDYQKKNVDPNHDEPDVPRPPKVANIWHNAFHEQLDDNTGEIRDMLAASALILSGSTDEGWKDQARYNQNLATSTREAILLTRRVGNGQLGIPVNKPADNKLMLVRASKKSIQLGGMSLFVIGPFEEDLLKLRKEWNAWLKKSKDALQQIRTQSRDIERDLGNEVTRLIQPLWIQAREFGDRTGVTTPNLASLMFFVEEKSTGATLLLTGDGHADDVIKGLEHYGRLDSDGKIHVDVLKVQHHGAEYNMTVDFAERITADNYIFCGNGGDKNPDLETLNVLVNARLNDGTKRKFTFWFNSHSTVAAGKKGSPAHMKKVEKQVTAAVKKSKGRMKSQYLKSASFTLRIS